MSVKFFPLGSAAGLSPSTWLLKLGCYGVTDIYNIMEGYPLSSFFETITLFMQVALHVCMCSYTHTSYR
jgi:hypothetical protein